MRQNHCQNELHFQQRKIIPNTHTCTSAKQNVLKFARLRHLFHFFRSEAVRVFPEIGMPVGCIGTYYNGAIGRNVAAGNGIAVKALSANYPCGRIKPQGFLDDLINKL